MMISRHPDWVWV